MKINGVEVVVHPGVLRSRSENTKYSHFAGDPAELKRRTLIAWFDAKFKPSNRQGARDTYVVSVNPQNFFAMRGARLVNERPDQVLEPRWEKKTAGRAEVVVRIVGRTPTGAVTKLEIIDLQAHPVESSTVSSAEVRPAV